MKLKEKPPNSIGQNLIFLSKLAWKLDRDIVIFPFLIVIFQLAQQMTELFIAPMILQKVEIAASLSELLLTIAAFTVTLLVLTGIKTWLMKAKINGDSNLLFYFYRIQYEKACTTSYVNTLSTAYRTKRLQADESLYLQSRATMLIEHFSKLLLALAGFGLYLLILSGLHSLLLTVVIITAVIGYFVNRRMNEWGYLHRNETDGELRQMSYISNTIMGNEMGKDVRIFGFGTWLQDIYASALGLYRAFCNRREKHYLAAGLVDVVLSILRNGIAYIYLIRLTLTEGLPASEFLLYFNAVSGFTQWVTTILDQISELHKCSLSLCQFREYLDWPEPFLFEEGEPLSYTPGTDYELRLNNVSYRYPEGNHETISHMDLTIRPGEKLAIVGLNGAGKTTLVKLLCGFLDPDEGQVLLNGQDIRKYNRRDYYRLFSAVFQDFSRLPSTIEANIAQAETNIDHARVSDCMEKAGLTETIEKLPKGVHTHYDKVIHDDGIELSGGQQQRLMLARALYKNAPILVLDEPTAALDPIAENEIYLKYNEMSAGRTTLFISHRLASTRFCDRILFLRDGAITEEGTHDELIKKGGEYADLFAVQSRYYQEGGQENGEG